MSASADIETQAAQWLLRQEEPGWSEQDQQALDLWLAVEQARRLSREGKRVALTCYSRGLAAWLERRVAATA